jgi:hypothetical protein
MFEIGYRVRLKGPEPQSTRKLVGTIMSFDKSDKNVAYVKFDIQPGWDSDKQQPVYVHDLQRVLGHGDHVGHYAMDGLSDKFVCSCGWESFRYLDGVHHAAKDFEDHHRDVMKDEYEFAEAPKPGATGKFRGLYGAIPFRVKSVEDGICHATYYPPHRDPYDAVFIWRFVAKHGGDEVNRLHVFDG